MLPQDITTPPHETNPDDDYDDITIIHDNRCYDNSNYDDDVADDAYTLDDNSFNFATGNDVYDYNGGWYDNDNDDDDDDRFLYIILF